MNRQSLGRKGEEAVERFLTKQGYRILARNFHTRWGELDIVAQDGAEVVFVEVKTRTSSDFVRPEEAVNFKKQDHLRKAAEIWLAKNYLLEPPPCRFDVVAVIIKKDNEHEIEHLRDAFQ
ncbi:YraN family protein [candidate division WOR-3 bacterium]|nr:YraN family protein [candidate division WOR-3 bacterium]